MDYPCIYIHHGGSWKTQPQLTYMGGSVVKVSTLPDDLDAGYIKGLIQNLGHKDICKVHYLVPWHAIHQSNLMLLHEDDSYMTMICLLCENREIHIYVEHDVYDVPEEVMSVECVEISSDGLSSDGTIGVEADDDIDGIVDCYVGNSAVEKTCWSVGQVFMDANHFKHEVMDTAARSGIDVIFTTNKKDRVGVKCKDESCGWRVWASRFGCGDEFKIKTLVSHHSCRGTEVGGMFQQPMRLSRAGEKHKCTNCSQYGHNMKGCRKALTAEALRRVTTRKYKMKQVGSSCCCRMATPDRTHTQRKKVSYHPAKPSLPMHKRGVGLYTYPSGLQIISSAKGFPTHKATVTPKHFNVGKEPCSGQSSSGARKAEKIIWDFTVEGTSKDPEIVDFT